MQREFINKPYNLLERYGKDSWALVTGATGGIGEEYCKQLASMGFNIVLSGRNERLLEEMEAKLHKAHPNIMTKTLVADWSESMESKYYKGLKDQLKGIDISILINNAGVCYWKFFDYVEPKELKDMIHTNLGSYMLLTRTLINDMMSRSKRSAIINVSSLASISPLSYQGCYSATKVGVRVFSSLLNSSYRSKIDVMNLTPGFVATKMVNFRDNPDTCTSEKCVKSSLKSLGQSTEMSPFIIHCIQGYIIQTLWRHLPTLWKTFAVNGMMREIVLEEFKKTHEKLE